MSDIIEARRLVVQVIKFGHIDSPSRQMLLEALKLMKREPACRRVAAREVFISAKVRKEIFRLADTDMTIHDIADAVGLRNSGRVSEVLNGKR